MTRATVVKLLLAFYAAAVAVIAFLPVPVDRGVSPGLHRFLRYIPWLKYEHVEFGANIVFFIPFGALLALLISRRYLVVPAAMIVTVTIESVQSIALKERTASVLDIVANVTGACVGLLLVELYEWSRRRSAARG